MRHLRTWLPLIAMTVLLTATALWGLKLRVPLGVPGKWVVEPNIGAWPTGAWLLPVGVDAIFGGAGALAAFDRFRRAKSRGEQAASTRACLASIMLLGLLWPWTLLGPGAVRVDPKHITLEGRLNVIASMWSDVATEYFGRAYEVASAREFSRDYASRWQHAASTSLAHVATHPPGAVLFFFAVRRFYEACPPLERGCTALAGTLTQEQPQVLYAAASLLRASASRSAGTPAPPPLPPSAVGGALFCAFVLGSTLVLALPAVFGLAALGAENEAQGDARGLAAAALFALAPTVGLFAFTLDAAVAALVVWSLWCIAKGMNGQFWPLAAAGALLATSAFVTFGALACLPLAAVALWLGAPKRGSRLWARNVALVGVGFLSMSALVWLVLPFDVEAVARSASAAHEMATLAHRSWAPWILLNLVTWALFMGWPVSVGAAIGWQRAPSRHVAPGEAMGMAALFVIVLLTLSGTVRGETERLWLFLLAPLLALAAVRLPLRMLPVAVALQALQTLLMAATLAPLVRPF